MKDFESLRNKSVEENEAELINFWKKDDILNKSIENRSKNQNYVFYDGPATANGNPGLHHMIAKFLKDTFCSDADCDTTYTNIGQVIGTTKVDGASTPTSIYPYPNDGTYSTSTPYIFKVENTGNLDSKGRC